MKHAAVVIIMTCFFSSLLGQNGKSSFLNLIIGTYTGKGKSEGIYVYRFNNKTGEFTYKSKVTGVENPSYLEIRPDRKFVYAGNEGGKGTVSSFSFNPVSGELVFLNKVSSGGSPCYVSVDKTGKFVFVGNYGGGTLAAILLKTDGTLNEEYQLIKHEGGTVILSNGRKQASHVHSTVLSPDNKYLMVPDLGMDKVNIYRFDVTKDSNPLTPADPPFVSIKAGSGPRHFVFHPSLKFAYVINEIVGSVTAFDYKNGKLTEKQTITLLAAGYSGSIEAQDIHISPDGKFLYGSNKGEADDITIYEIRKDGTLLLAGHQKTLGKGPRNFVIDPTGNFLLAANMYTNEIVIFSRNKKTGMLTALDKRIQVWSPVCLKFAAE